jgi:hypothetical protein
MARRRAQLRLRSGLETRFRTQLIIMIHAGTQANLQVLKKNSAKASRQVVFYPL